MHTFFNYFIGFTLLVSGTVAYAEQNQDVFSAFQNLKKIATPSIIVPTLVSLPVEKDVVDGGMLAMYEEEANSFIPYRVEETYTTQPLRMSVNSGGKNDWDLTDNNLGTGATFDLSEESENAVLLNLSFAAPVTSTALEFELDRYVSLPTSISIIGVQDGAERIVLAPTRMTGTKVFFPEATAALWKVRLTYVQPLRINEIHLTQDTAEKSVTRNIIFLAQPQKKYTLYFNADRYVNFNVIEAGDLFGTRDARVLQSAVTEINTSYKEADADGDTVPDLRDNCVQIANADQTDIDKNGRGDLCDDYDRDGFIQSADNCPTIANAGQYDEDSDGIGDACDDAESRLTEKYVWIPWVGMGIAMFVLLVLSILVATHPKRPEEPIV